MVITVDPDFRRVRPAIENPLFLRQDSLFGGENLGRFVAKYVRKG